MLDFDVCLEDGTSISVWQMDEDISTLKVDAGKIINFSKLSAKRQREKAFAYHLLEQKMPGATISYEENGKPHIAGNAATGISISHSYNHVCLMLSKHNANIGIDIERNQTAKVLRVRHKFMTDEEVALHPTNDEGLDALLAWTTKEALFKMATLPHYDFIEGFSIKTYTLKGNEGTSLVEDLMNGKTYKVYHHVKEAYVMSYTLGETL